MTTTLAYLVLIYLLVGLLFAVVFAIRGCAALDEGAKTSGIGFRLMIIPAAALLWPYLLRRWAGGNHD